ncbi:MAG: hypothetical protein AB7P37_08880 [Ramlibacter sp.]
MCIDDNAQHFRVAPMNRIAHFLNSRANWAGIGSATLALMLPMLGPDPGWVWLLTPLGYCVGFAVAGMWVGFPRLSTQPWAALEFKDEGDPYKVMDHALQAVRNLVNANPDNRLPAGLQARALALCDQLKALLEQWELSRATLSIEESFHARHIILRYLPDALRNYSAIPQRFAQSRLLDNGRTAEDTLHTTLDELSAKVRQLTDDLASQNAEAFVNHSRFLHQKFGASDNSFQGPLP